MCGGVARHGAEPLLPVAHRRLPGEDARAHVHLERDGPGERDRDADAPRGIVRERQATFSLHAAEPARPPNQTPVPGFFLAGDWTDTGLPGTIEGAAASGHAAAHTMLEFEC